MPESFSQVTALRAQSRRLGLEDRMIFARPRADVRRILAATDIYAMPSRNKAFGMSFVKAMAMGCPIIAASAGGVRGVATDGATGLRHGRAASPSSRRTSRGSLAIPRCAAPWDRRAVPASRASRTRLCVAAEIEGVYHEPLSPSRATDRRRAA